MGFFSRLFGGDDIPITFAYRYKLTFLILLNGKPILHESVIKSNSLQDAVTCFIEKYNNTLIKVEQI